MIGLATMIKILSSGPVLFRQDRIGLGGRRFVCLKFRTMHTNANTVAHERHVAELMRSNRPMTKLDGHDPRLIPLAWVLRSTGLDELPQLFNVLRGEMSLVGPRPCTPQEYKCYAKDQRARFGTLPGLTGLWQVSGKNRTTFDEMITLDILYLQTQCLSLDFGIMVHTPLVVLRQVVEATFVREKVPPPVASSVRSSMEDVATTALFQGPGSIQRRISASPAPRPREVVPS